SSMMPITSPTVATCPRSFMTCEMMPLTGAGNSTVALSVSISTTVSSFSARSPGCLSHAPICTSVIDSPTWGTLSSIAIFFRLSFRRQVCRRLKSYLPHCKRFHQQLLLFHHVAAGRARRRAGCRRPRHQLHRKTIQQFFAEMEFDVPARAHVLRLLLHPI